MVIKRIVVGSFASNCYIVGSETTKEGMIVDPGDDAGQILENVSGSGLDIKLIVLTHGHIDHIGALKRVRETTKAEVCIHSDDGRFIQERPVTSEFGISYPSLSAPDRLLKDGDNINVGDSRFLVLHTPGHTPGSICLLGSDVVFTGDTLFNYGIGRTDFSGGNHIQLINSIHTKLMVLPDSTVAYPGHGPETTIGVERRGNPFLR